MSTLKPNWNRDDTEVQPFRVRIQMEAPKPLNEEQRLQALHDYQILDTESEAVFDDAVHIAAHVCDTPIALISLIDEGRQWFKAKVGVDVSETPREQAFCAYAILDEHPLVVRDATTDERFADNPLVTGDPNIRFYAGAPLVTPCGFNLGTLCVIDRRPREIPLAKLSVLESVARQTVRLLEHRKVAKRLATALDRARVLSGLIPVCAHCRRVRDDGPYWNQLEDYLTAHTAGSPSPGICPSCGEESAFDDSGAGRFRSAPSGQTG